MSNGHKLYKAYLSEGKIEYWDIENQKWGRSNKTKIAFKAIDDSYFKNTDSLNMLWESYPNDDYQEHVTINSLTNSEDMTEKRWFCLDDSSDINSEFLNEIKSYISDHFTFIVKCFGITQDPNTKDYMMVLEYCERGDLRNCLNELNESNSFVSCKVKLVYPMISDLGMCQPTNNKKQEGVYGVLPYMAPEVLCGYQYTKAADIYSFGMNISENRPTAKELYQSLEKLHDGTPNDHIFNNTENSYNETNNKEDNYYFQVKKWDIIREKKLRSNFKKNKENIAKNIQTHPQAIYINAISSTISQCLDCELDELDLNQDDKTTIIKFLET
ncbi:unnamed protein product [Rhizophagus irregularis]|nr:unnamed protein product [Rhizophagus irregularis]